MFRWYRSSVVCYAYLSDVAPDSREVCEITGSQWFKRGWTLQELIAPRSVVFFSGDWTAIGTRRTHASQISALTHIPESPLDLGYDEEHHYLIAEVMSWAEGRETTRIEDRAYSLLGLFNVYMPMLYGEGERAFTRLQEEIMKQSGDQSLFAWSGIGTKHPSALARSPDFFPYVEDCDAYGLSRRHSSSATSGGVAAEFVLVPWAPDMYLAVLNYSVENLQQRYRLQGIFLRALDHHDRFVRCRYAGKDIWTSFEYIRRDDEISPEKALDYWGQALGNPAGAPKVSPVTIVQHLTSEAETQAARPGNDGMYSAFKVHYDGANLLCGIRGPSEHYYSIAMEESTHGWLKTFEVEPSPRNGNLSAIAIGLDAQFTTLCTLSSLSLKIDRRFFNQFAHRDIIWTPEKLLPEGVYAPDPPQSRKAEDSLWVVELRQGRASTTQSPPGTLCLKLGHQYGARSKTAIRLGTSSKGTLHKGRIPATALDLTLEGRCPITLRLVPIIVQD